MPSRFTILLSFAFSRGGKSSRSATESNDLNNEMKRIINDCKELQRWGRTTRESTTMMDECQSTIILKFNTVVAPPRIILTICAMGTVGRENIGTSSGKGFFFQGRCYAIYSRYKKELENIGTPMHAWQLSVMSIIFVFAWKEKKRKKAWKADKLRCQKEWGLGDGAGVSPSNATPPPPRT